MSDRPSSASSAPRSAWGTRGPRGGPSTRSSCVSSVLNSPGFSVVGRRSRRVISTFENTARLDDVRVVRADAEADVERLLERDAHRAAGELRLLPFGSERHVERSCRASRAAAASAGARWPAPRASRRPSLRGTGARRPVAVRCRVDVGRVGVEALADHQDTPCGAVAAVVARRCRPPATRRPTLSSTRSGTRRRRPHVLAAAATV